MILVSGATGTTGGQVVRHLSERGAEFRALAHSDASAAKLREQGVDAVVGDFDAPDSLTAALEGADHAFLVTPPHEGQVEWEGGFIDAAKHAGVDHVVKLSVIGADPEASVRLARGHAQSEQHLRDSGVGYTLLRPNGFMENFLANAGSIASDGIFYSSIGDAQVSWVAASDIGGAAAAALTEEGHLGKTYELTGPSAISYEELARTLSDKLGKEVRHQQVPDDDARAAMLGMGMGEWLVGGLVELFEVYRAGYASGVQSGVTDASGRDPEPFEEWIELNRAAFED